MQSFLKQPQNLLDAALFKFFLVGCVNTVVGCLVMAVCYSIFGWGYWISSAMNYLVSSSTSYFLNRKFTFGDCRGSWKMMVRFACNIVCCYILSFSLARVITLMMLAKADSLMVERMAMLIGIALFSVFNYIGQSRFVFIQTICG